MSKESIYSLPSHKQGPLVPWAKTAFVLASGFMMLGVLVMGIAGGSAYRAISKGGQSLSFPGASTVTLKEGIYFGVQDPREKTRADGLYVSVIDQTTNESVPVTMSGLGRGEDIQKNPTLFQFQVNFDGPYNVQGTTALAGVTTKILLLHESFARARTDLAVGVIAGVLLVGGGLFLFIATHKKVKKAKALLDKQMK